MLPDQNPQVSTSKDLNVLVWKTGTGEAAAASRKERLMVKGDERIVTTRTLIASP